MSKQNKYYDLMQTIKADEEMAAAQNELTVHPKKIALLSQAAHVAVHEPPHCRTWAPMLRYMGLLRQECEPAPSQTGAFR